MSKRKPCPTIRQCIVCQRGFQPRRIDSTICSVKCRSYWHHLDVTWRRQRSHVDPTCSLCGRSFTGLAKARDSERFKNRYCSQACWMFDDDHCNLTHDRCRVMWRTCRDCPTVFIARARSSKLCDPCGIEATRDINRRKNTKRRQAQLNGEPYRAVDIFDRDGWRCHICRKGISRTAPRNSPRGASVDHLVPLCDGGADAPANVAASHLQCNALRRHGGRAQLLLVG